MEGLWSVLRLYRISSGLCNGVNGGRILAVPITGQLIVIIIIIIIIITIIHIWFELWITSDVVEGEGHEINMKAVVLNLCTLLWIRPLPWVLFA